MVWAVMFQGITVFVFIIIFCNDKHNQAIVSRKKRFLYSTLLFIGTDFLLRLFLGDRPLKFWKWKYEKSHVPFTNHTSDWVPKENVKWPTGVDYWRGIFGQRRWYDK